MRGFESILQESSAGDDFDLIFDKVQETVSRMAQTLEPLGYWENEKYTFSDILLEHSWINKDQRKVNVYVTDPDHSNLITMIIAGSQVYHLLSHQEYSDPASVTGEVGKRYMEALEKIPEWLKKVLS